jgi:hypothetical protein
MFGHACGAMPWIGRDAPSRSPVKSSTYSVLVSGLAFAPLSASVPASASGFVCDSHRKANGRELLDTEETV